MKKGFTLVEILVTIAVISILAGIVMFSSAKIRTQGGLTRAKAELEEIANAAVLYYQDKEAWPVDAKGSNGTSYNTYFYNNSKYFPGNASNPSSYLSSDYFFDWQSWGNYTYNKINPDGSASGSQESSGKFPKVSSSVGSPPPGETGMSGLACWQSIDLINKNGKYQSYGLVARKCLRDVCPSQYYCKDDPNCYDTAAHRDAGGATGRKGGLQTSDPGPALSAICEECTNEEDCQYKYR